MCNDIIWSMEKQQITMMVILDLSAAFDTVDYISSCSIFYKITMESQIKPYKWFNNYLWPCSTSR